MIKLAIQTILPGFSASDNIRKKGEFGASLGIDPVLPDTDGGTRPSGIIRPTQYAKFSGSNVNATPLFIRTNPKTATTYVLLSNGRLISYNSSLGSETLVGTLTNAKCNGAEYYDNYIHFAGTVLQGRYGPLDGTPTLTQDYWNGTLGLTALRNEDYPDINGVTIPNHFMWRHTDNALYICNVLATNKGSLNKIKTTKTTVEGDTDDTEKPSTADALDLLYGWYPVTMCSFGTYLLIAFIEGTKTTIKQKPARLILWDTVSDSYEDVTVDKNFSEPIISALQPLNNGSVMIYSGKGGTKRGCRVDMFQSLNAVQPVGYYPDLFPPLQGAVDSYSGRNIFGTGCTIPATAGCVIAEGSPYPEMPMGTHNVIKSTLAGASPMVSALAYVQQDNADLVPIIGCKDAVSTQLEKLTDSTNTSLVIKIYFDNGSKNTTLATIDNTSDRWASKHEIDIKSENLMGKNDFYIQFEWQNGDILRSEKEIIGKHFNIDRIHFNFASALSAVAGSATAFLGAIQYPMVIEINDAIR